MSGVASGCILHQDLEINEGIFHGASFIFAHHNHKKLIKVVDTGIRGSLLLSKLMKGWPSDACKVPK